MSENCKYPRCEKDRQGDTPYGSKFCSTQHEVKYDHLMSDARDAERAANEPEPDYPEPRKHPDEP